MKTRQAAFYLPVNFDPTLPPEPQRDYAHYFLNLLHWKWISWRANENDFICLKYDYLTKIIPRAMWLEIRGRLESAMIIECDHRCQRNVKSYGYRLGPEYHKARRIVCRDDVLNKFALSDSSWIMGQANWPDQISPEVIWISICRASANRFLSCGLNLH